MTMPGEPTRTLVDDLDAIAADEEEAANHPYCDPGPHGKYAARAARLRAAAARLREEMELSRRRIIETYRANEAPAHAAWNLVDKALRSVNNGPLPAAPPATCGTCGLPSDHANCRCDEIRDRLDAGDFAACADPTSGERAQHGGPPMTLDDVAAAERAAPTCKTWCGLALPKRPPEPSWLQFSTSRFFCSSSCEFNGAPLHPAPGLVRP